MEQEEKIDGNSERLDARECSYLLQTDYDWSA